jgi:hypothetical protein
MMMFESILESLLMYDCTGQKYGDGRNKKR